MLSPDATRDVAARPAPSAGERELKFTLPAGLAHLARRRLESVCRRDPEFPAAVVWTIYYDTPALASLGEKINSDYLKRKIRVRWYSDLEGCVSGPAFVEAKFRMGTRRSKVRARLPYSADEVAGWDLQDPRLLSFPLLLREQGVLNQESWQPMMLIRYRRDRFIEPFTGSRVSLDADISGAAANPRFLTAPDRSPLATAVLEVKGQGDELPAALRPLLALGLQKRSFSKFLVVHAHMTRSPL
jgi:VTC domain-containing protein